MEKYIPDPNDYCIDCDVNTLLIGEYYMVNASVWALTNLGPYDGMLCISCLEKRISRQLTPNDFPSLPINTNFIFKKSNLLKLRMS